MKTLLLTSSGKTVSKFLPEIIGKQGSDLKVAWITTAAKVIDDLSYLEIRRDSMIEMGWDFEEIDIEGQNQDELLAKLKDKDAIYIEGGNNDGSIFQIETATVEILPEKTNRYLC